MRTTALAFTALLIGATPALADWNGRGGGYHGGNGGGWHEHHHGNGNAWVPGVVLGLGALGALGGALLYPPPPVYYPPPTVYYPPQQPYYPQQYYAPPPAYYPQQQGW
jgi:hypothetical protein